MGQELYSISPHTRILLWPKKKRKVSIFQKKNLLQWLLTAFCHILFRFFGCKSTKKRSCFFGWDPYFFPQNSPRSQERSTVKTPLPEIAAWHESLVEIHQFGRHLASSVDQNPSRTAHECLKRVEFVEDNEERGGAKMCVFFVFFFRTLAPLFLFGGIFFFEKSSTT